MNVSDKFKTQIYLLPEKDRKYALKFINERNFEALYELVVSDIRKLEITDKEINEDLYSFSSSIFSYLRILGVTDDDEYYDEDE